MLLLRMLSLGQGAWDMIDSQVFKEPRLVRTMSQCLTSGAPVHKITSSFKVTTKKQSGCKWFKIESFVCSG